MAAPGAEDRLERDAAQVYGASGGFVSWHCGQNAVTYRLILRTA